MRDRSRTHRPRRVTAFIAVALLAGCVVGATASLAQPSGVTRTDLQRHDLSIPGRETIQARVDFAPGAVAARHSHPGEEVIYVLAGTLEYQIDGQAPVTVPAGQVFLIPAGMVHRARNVGEGMASELATYIVEKGTPLVKPADEGR